METNFVAKYFSHHSIVGLRARVVYSIIISQYNVYGIPEILTTSKYIKGL